MPIFPGLRLFCQISFLLTCIGSLGLSFSSPAQDRSRNFILSRTYKVPQTNPAIAVSVGEATQTVEYMDGLGRLQQTVQVQADKNRKDIVAPLEYDALGRLSRTYLPAPAPSQSGTFQPNATALVSAYNTDPGGGLYNYFRYADTPGKPVFTESRYEASPLSRPTGQVSAGATQSTTISYGINGNTEVKLYVAGVNLTDISQSGFYAAGQLTKTISKDEAGKTLTDYKDKDGRTVLRRQGEGQSLDTYYVYDDLNQLRAVLQPMFQTTPDVGRFAFLYTYTGRGLVAQRKVPGAGAVTNTYNTRDLLVGMLDGKAQQFYYEYDALNRQTVMGLCTTSPCNLTSAADQTNKAPLQYTYYDTYEAFTPSGQKLGDEFSFLRDATTYNWSTGGSDFVPANPRLNRIGQPTGSSVRLLNADGSLGATWLGQAIYYDDRYRVVQTVRRTNLGAQGLERISYQRDFAGKVLAEKTRQSWSSQWYEVEKLYSYDHSERLTATRLKTSSSNAGALPPKDVFQNVLVYNEVGQLSDKFLNATDANGSRAVERLTYLSDLRGWLREQRGVARPSRPFRLSLTYEANSNPATLGWQYPTPANTGTYAYNYDAFDRLMSGRAANGSGQGEALTYDFNGNIQTLQRYDATGGQIDNLAYTYWGDNRLRLVTDATANPNGFNNGSSGTGDDFYYDQNGNQTTDNNRGANLAYNCLNLPRQLTLNGKTLGYVYDAGGQKRSVDVAGSVTSYEGLFEYDGAGLPTRIQTEEGQLVKVGSTWQWQYYLRDQQNNVRVVLDETGAVVQETDYFPFGLPIPKTPTTLADSRAKNKYLFLNRELQAETGYLDLLARHYDPSIGRFMTVDPLTDQQEHLSPYQYGYNNPLRFSDPNGKCPGCDDPFLFAKLVVTAFYDTKHAIENTVARAVGSDTRFGYKVVNGQQVFETVAYKQAPINSTGDAVREVANAALDMASVTGARVGGVTGGLLAKTGTTQTTKALKETIELRHYTSNKGLEAIQNDRKIKAFDQNTVFAEKAKGKPLSSADAAEKYGIAKGSARNYVQFEVEANRVNIVKNPVTGAKEYTIKGDVDLNEKAKFFKRN